MWLDDAIVAISGMGLMGGSLSLALRGRCKERIGVARSEQTARAALEIGAVDAACTDIRAAAERADVVVLATPVRHILSTIDEIGPHLRPGTLLIDLGSTKTRIAERMDALPEGVMAVGGHPMCGKETGGLRSADPSLFAGAVFALVPTEHTHGEAMSRARDLACALGSRPLVMERRRHDRAVAIVSHLPYLLAASLAHTEAEGEALDPLVRTLAASGFRDTTRVAASEVPMMLDILLTNREEVEAALDACLAQLTRARDLLDRATELEAWMTSARDSRRGMFS